MKFIPLGQVLVIVGFPVAVLGLCSQRKRGIFMLGQIV